MSRSAFFHRVIEFSSREMARFGAPSLLTRNTNDVQQVQMLVLTTFTMLIAAPIMMVGGVFMALREDVGLSWLVAVTVLVLVAIIAFLVVPHGARVPAHADGASTPSTRCCASRSPASGWSGRSSANRSRPSGSAKPTPT